jgi:hypothetical protein
MLVTNEESHFMKLKEIVCKDDFTGVSGYELTGILVNLSNFCAERISSGEYRFSAHAVDVYQTLLKRNLYLQSGVISHIFFTNVVVHSIYCNKTEWISGFIKSYQKYLQPGLKESTINYCYAHLNFYNKNYNEVLKCLSKSYTNSILRQLNIKAMQARVYFELNETESLNYLLDTYKHTLLNAKKIPVNIYDGQMQYIKNIKTLLNISVNYNKAVAEKFEANLKTSKAVYREWLLEKIRGLAKN